MKKQITIKDFHELNDTFEKMNMAISFFKTNKREFNIDVLAEHLESAKDFWVKLYREKGI